MVLYGKENNMTNHCKYSCACCANGAQTYSALPIPKFVWNNPELQEIRDVWPHTYDLNFCHFGSLNCKYQFNYTLKFNHKVCDMFFFLRRHCRCQHVLLLLLLSIMLPVPTKYYFTLKEMKKVPMWVVAPICEDDRIQNLESL